MTKKIVPKVFVELPDDRLVKYLFRGIGWDLACATADADLIILSGGEDVTPSLYGEDAHPSTSSSLSRDARTSVILDHAVKHGIPVIGICRGAQFLNVACGGRMYQHVLNHTKNHRLLDLPTGKVCEVTSTHHQQMIANTGLGVVRAVAHLMDYPIRFTMEGGAPKQYSGIAGYGDVKDEIEVVFYPHVNGLCFQPHPEYGHHSTTSYFFDLMEEYYPQFDYALVPVYLETLK